MVAIATQLPKQASEKKVPDYLVKDEIDGIRFYYKDYKYVMRSKDEAKEVHGSTAIQSFIASYFAALFFDNQLNEIYHFFTGKSRNRIDKNTILEFDIAFYDKNTILNIVKNNLPIENIAPNIVVEFDSQISLDGTEFEDTTTYYFTKTKKLIAYGTQKVIWVFTASQKILVAEGKDWHIYDFDKTIQLIDNVEFNIADFLQKEQIVL